MWGWPAETSDFDREPKCPYSAGSSPLGEARGVTPYFLGARPPKCVPLLHPEKTAPVHPPSLSFDSLCTAICCVGRDSGG